MLIQRRNAKSGIHEAWYADCMYFEQPCVHHGMICYQQLRALLSSLWAVRLHAPGEHPQRLLGTYVACMETGIGLAAMSIQVPNFIRTVNVSDTQCVLSVLALCHPVS